MIETRFKSMNEISSLHFVCAQRGQNLFLRFGSFSALKNPGRQFEIKFATPQLQNSATQIKERLLSWCRAKTKEYDVRKLFISHFRKFTISNRECFSKFEKKNTVKK